MDKESIRLILANIPQLADIVQLNDGEIEKAIAMLDGMVVEEKGPGFSIEAPAYPLSELPYYLEKSGAVSVKFSSEMQLTDFTRFARPVTEAELTRAFGKTY
ncbi:hypothetical protein HZB78_00530 [Candidatus Collierbacteria bacterium]|nr:hypothetical protein [Candidatus Collierbacteria bacterium]